MPQLLDKISAVSADVLKIEHRSSEPFDHPLNPATIDTIDFSVGQVAAIDANGFVVRADKDNIATIKLVGLFMLSREPEDGLKNNYVDASGNASIFSTGIVTLDTQIADASVAAGADLYIGDDGQITTTVVNKVIATGDSSTDVTIPDASARIGTAMTARTVAGAPVRVKLEL